MYVMGKHTTVPMGLQRFSPIHYEKDGDRRFVCNMEGWSLSSCALGSISNCHEFSKTEVEEFWEFLKTCTWNSGYKIRNFTMLLKDLGPTYTPSPALQEQVPSFRRCSSTLFL